MKTNNQNYWKEYWKTVEKCVAYPDGRTEIYHVNKVIECFDKRGKFIGQKKIFEKTP